MTPKWEHSPETKEYSESWKIAIDGKVIAMVVREHTVYSASIYPLGKHRRIGDVYGSASGAKSACVRQLRKTGVIA